MSWISGIADKAEEFLNKIDQNAAVALNKKDKSRSSKTLPVSVNDNVDDHLRHNGLSPVKRSTSPLPSKPVMKLSGNSRSSPTIPPVSSEEEHLIDFLNNSAAVDIDVQQEESEPLVNGHSDRVEINITEDMRELLSENQLLKNEIRSLNNEISLLMSRLRKSDRDGSALENRLTEKEVELSTAKQELNVAKDKINELEQRLECNNHNDTQKEECISCGHSEMLATVQRDMSQYQLQTQLKEEGLRKEILQLKLLLEEKESEKTRSIEESAKELALVKVDLEESRNELEQYRIRAQRVLAEKEELIGKLKEGMNFEENGSNSLTSLEITQLRNERSALLEELEEERKKLEGAREAIKEWETKFECNRDDLGSRLKEIQNKLIEEQNRRSAAEDHSKSLTEEVHSVREELSRQVSALTSRLRERDSELSRLRTQMVTTRNNSSPSRGARHETATELTAALVRKQAALEEVTMERNQLRLQLEQTKAKYRNFGAQRLINLNDTDDAKAQLPSFLMETPFDTGVTRRMKRAYSCLDAISGRTGVFLRRNPLARTLLFFYVIFLHIWVFFVLWARAPAT